MIKYKPKQKSKLNTATQQTKQNKTKQSKAKQNNTKPLKVIK